ncbi:hypothetical protein [Micromonospora sp. CPCC 206061]|uniref:hypothetical protein n=1 Tax=Micromonospora sp. CPCC 206061 TaxID=3122410 RepID=UPI002FEF40CE
MTFDVEDRLAATLRTRADREVDADALLGGSLARGRRRQRHRRIGMALAGAGVAGVTTAALAAVPLVLSDGGGGASIGSAETPASPPGRIGQIGPDAEPPVRGAYPVPALAAQGVPGAADAPEKVGREPGNIHFRVEKLSLPVQGVTWAVQPDGVEEMTLSITGADGGPATGRVQLAAGKVPEPESSGPARGEPGGPVVTTEKPVHIGDRTGTLSVIEESGFTSYEVRWSPADGLEAIVGGFELDEADVIALAHAVRWDQAVRCAAPLQLTALPQGAGIKGCTVRFSTEDITWVPESVLTLNGPGAAMKVEMGGPFIPSASFSASPGDLPDRGWVGDGDQTLQIYSLDGVPVRLTPTGYPKDVAEMVANGLRMPAGTDPNKPETWPTSLTG